MAGLAFTILTGMYFLPTILAAARGNHSTLGVGLLNFFAGWTFIGWIVALVWALTGERDYPHVVYVPYGVPHSYVNRGGLPMNIER